MAELKALIFDVDGTLADTEEGHRIAFNQAFANNNLDWNWSSELYGKLLAVTGGKERMKFYIKAYNPSVPEVDDLDAFIADLHKQKTALYSRTIEEGKMPLRPGVKRLMLEAREQGIRLAIATTTSPKNVEVLLTHSVAEDAMSWFDVIAAGDIVKAKKPASDIFDHALAQLGLHPDNCVALEDSANGLKSARGANLRTIVTVNNYTKNDNFDGATLVVSHFGEPDNHFEVLSGEVDTNQYQYVNIDLLKSL